MSYLFGLIVLHFILNAFDESRKQFKGILEKVIIIATDNRIIVLVEVKEALALIGRDFPASSYFLGRFLIRLGLTHGLSKLRNHNYISLWRRSTKPLKLCDLGGILAFSSCSMRTSLDANAWIIQFNRYEVEELVNPLGLGSGMQHLHKQDQPKY